MEVREIQDKSVWEEFILGRREKTFLSSWSWGEFQEKRGNKAWRLGVFDNGLVGVALVVKIVAKRGSYLLVPHGPVSEFSNKPELIGCLLKELKGIAAREKVDFIRISPVWKRNRESIEAFRDNGFRDSSMYEHPESSWKLGLELSEDDLMKNMRKTTRYLIKQAIKDPEIEVVQSVDINDVDRFNELHKEVVKLQKFTPFSLEYFREEFSVFNKDNQICLFLGSYKGKLVACSYVVFWSGIGFYHHAALLPEFHKVPVSYLLQWESIKEAKRRGCFIYDFWGYADPKKNPRHPYAGPTLFKMGFGGELSEYVKSQDYILSPRYYLTYIFETLRRIKRGL